MGKIRYINGWECPCCYELYPTERKAKNCFKRCSNYYKSIKDIPKKDILLRRGWECRDCLKIYNKKEIAKDCCHPNYFQEDEEHSYNEILKWKRKKKNKLDALSEVDGE